VEEELPPAGAAVAEERWFRALLDAHGLSLGAEESKEEEEEGGGMAREDEVLGGVRQRGEMSEVPEDNNNHSVQQ
jgi:hypothetical protein